ncbi:MAG: elongation factor G [Dehalococcoidia bacterium]|jgi:elongation factor G|nr:elongation factor G [Dehalococcoidia bacterium]
MTAISAERIRNTALLSHSGAGKTSLAEAMLFAAKAIPRLGKVDDGTTTSDYEPEEAKRRISLNLTVLPCTWLDYKLNLLDAPGYADFIGDVKVSLRVTEGAVVVIDAAAGVEVGTEIAWHILGEASLPRLIFINKMDRENADFFATLDAATSKLGARAVPVQLPIGAEAGFQGVVDLITGKAYTGSDDQETEVPADMADVVSTYREKLTEAAIETDDELLTKYLEGEEVTEEELRRGLEQGVRQGQLVPVLAGSALKNIGVRFLMDAIVRYLPSPAGVAPPEGLEVSTTTPPAALVFKTTADPYVGKLSYFRVYSGTVASNSHVWNSTKQHDERMGQLYLVRGKTQEPAPEVAAGDIGAVAKLSVTTTGDTLGTKEHPTSLPGITFPTPILRMAVQPKTKADLDKMGLSLPRLMEEDPTILIQREADTGETLLAGMGETHLEVAVERLQRKFGLDVKVQIPKVPYKATVTTPAKADYRHKKQTGGHGQFAHVFLEISPLPRGSGRVEFASRIVGGAISKSYIPAVEKGVMEASHDAGLGGYPVVDVKATLYDGKEHPVDSSDICFKIAGSHALKEGLSEAQPVLLEPVMKIEVEVPEPLTGEIIGDLNTKRAKVLGMSPQGGINVIEALAPMSEVQRYLIDLRSMTQGRGRFTMEFSHYEEVPAQLTQRIVAEKQQDKASEKV